MYVLVRTFFHVHVSIHSYTCTVVLYVYMIHIYVVMMWHTCTLLLTSYAWITIHAYDVNSNVCSIHAHQFHLVWLLHCIQAASSPTVAYSLCMWQPALHSSKRRGKLAWTVHICMHVRLGLQGCKPHTPMPYVLLITTPPYMPASMCTTCMEHWHHVYI